MSNDPILYTLETAPPAITALSTRDGHVVARFDARWGTPDGLWVDPVAGQITWTNMGADWEAADGTIERARLDGSQHEVLVGKGQIVTPKQLAVDRAEGHLYWCDREGMRIMRSNLDGTAIEVLLKRGNYPQDMPDFSRQCVGITLDLITRQIYWTQKGSPKGGIGRIFRMPMAMPEGSDPSSRTDIETLADHLPEPIDLHVCPGSNRLYWTDRGAAPDGNSLNMARIGARGLLEHKVILRGLNEGIGLAIDKTETSAFVSDLGGTIRVVDLKTGESHVLRQQSATTGIYLVE
ncbi:SMP-30/gluconolactonase/LRE family protein [Asaia platycodi]|uniref:hypothetical protein n=1 Tax=Asaia platycodi TaxID=610243 RepID=UPI00068890CA|nr:hypothetical protein [Asaia platycodi]